MEWSYLFIFWGADGNKSFGHCTLETSLLYISVFPGRAGKIQFNSPAQDAIAYQDRSSKDRFLIRRLNINKLTQRFYEKLLSLKKYSLLADSSVFHTQQALNCLIVFIEHLNIDQQTILAELSRDNDIRPLTNLLNLCSLLLSSSTLKDIFKSLESLIPHCLFGVYRDIKFSDGKGFIYCHAVADGSVERCQTAEECLQRLLHDASLLLKKA